MRLVACLLTAVLLGALLVAPTAAGDWLVLRDGSRIETEGPWSTKGRQVIFTRAGGSLSALRLADVDLEASESATAESRKPATSSRDSDAAATDPRSRRQPSALVLTDKDIRSATPEPVGIDNDSTEPGNANADPSSAETSVEDPASGDPASGDPASGDPASGDPASGDPASGDPVVMVSWDSRESSDIDGLEITGSVRNTGADIAAGIKVGVQVVDENEDLLVDNQAFLQATSLAPGQRSTFKVLLPGIYSLLADPMFEVTSEAITIQGPRRDEETEEGSEPES